MRAFYVMTFFALVACESDGLATAPVYDGGGAPDADSEPDAGEQNDAGVARDAAAPDAMPPPPAPEPIYIHTGATLYAYDSANNTTTSIGDFKLGRARIEDMADIAIDRTGRMFGGTVTKKIYVINPITAACDYEFDVEDRVHGMTFLPSGELVIAGDFVRVLDPSTGRVVRELVDDQGYLTSGDIVGLPDGNLYWTVRGDQNGGDLVIRIDPSTRVLHRLGAANAQRLYGLGYADDVLFGFSADGKVVELDASSGLVIRELTLPGRWWGATTNPVVW